MLSTVAVVLPVFALVGAGWLAGRLGVLGRHATATLSRFVVYLALPALMVDVVAHARWAEVWRPDFVLAFGGSTAAVFGLVVALRLRGSRPLPDAAIDGLNGAYANTGFMGFPLAAAAYGPAALAPVLVASLLTVCALFGAAIVLVEVGLVAGLRGREVALKVARSLARNPLLVAPVLGALVPVLGLPVPSPVDGALKLLGGAASPCALVALGLFLSERGEAAGRDGRATAALVAVKLALHPLLAWVLAGPVLGLPPLLAHVAVLMAALPTGTGPFMLAEVYGREAGVTGDTVLGSTVLSLVTLAGFLAVAG